jgi:hypothetical protein
LSSDAVDASATSSQDSVGFVVGKGVAGVGAGVVGA